MGVLKYRVEVGMKFNRLTVTHVLPKHIGNETYFACFCECGSGKVVKARGNQIAKGDVKSCGCHSRDMAKNSIKTAFAYRRKNQPCELCNKQFLSVSQKQKHCSDECRFIAYQNKGAEAECWEWAGPCNSNGYGVLCITNAKKQVVQAHRYAYQKYVGELVDGLCIMHTCDNPRCTNPAHLVQGTWAENNADRSRKGRSGKRVFSDEERQRYSLMNQGEKSNLAKLTETQVREILADRSLGCVRASKKYGVNPATIKNIRAGRAWKHVTRGLQ